MNSFRPFISQIYLGQTVQQQMGNVSYSEDTRVSCFLFERMYSYQEFLEAMYVLFGLDNRIHRLSMFLLYTYNNMSNVCEILGDPSLSVLYFMANNDPQYVGHIHLKFQANQVEAPEVLTSHFRDCTVNNAVASSSQQHADYHNEPSTADPEMIFDDSDQNCTSESESDEDSYDGGTNSDSEGVADDDEECNNAFEEWPLLQSPVNVPQNQGVEDRMDMWDWADEHQMDMWSEASGEIRIGMLFKTKKELKRALTIWSVRNNREFHVDLSDRTRFRGICQTIHVPPVSQRREPCKWHVYASIKKNGSLWQISQWVRAHNCYGSVSHNNNRNVTSEFIAHEVKHMVETDVAVKVKLIQGYIKEKLNVQVSYHKAWHGRRKAIEAVYGTWESNFQELPTYIDALVKANPGTIVEWQHDEREASVGHKFKYIFWAFGPAIEAFRYCMPVICVDGTHLRGSYMGKLLLAVTKDADNHILTLAYAIVDKESIESWRWFMEQLRYFVANRSSRSLCVISDRHVGICRAMETLSEWQEPNAYHRFCLRHIRSNLMTNFKDVRLKKLCWALGSTTQRIKYRHHLREMRLINDDAWKYLENIDKSKWSLIFDHGNRRWGNLTSNIVESMNNALRVARLLPIKACIQHTFHKTVDDFRNRKNIAMECDTQLPPRMWQIFAARDGHAQEHTVREFDREGAVYEVVSRLTTNARGGHDYTVHYSKSTCECGKWQVKRFPCSHAIAVCRYRGDDPHDTVSKYYTTRYNRMQYKYSLHPLGRKERWLDPGWTIHADVWKITTKRGRRRARRIHNEMDVTQPEERGPRKCTICRQPGHNRLKCPARDSN